MANSSRPITIRFRGRENGMATVYTSGEWRIKEGREQEFISLWQEFASWTTQNFPEAVGARLLQNREDSTLFVSFGQWEGEEAIPTWRGSPEFQQGMAKMSETLENMDMRALDVVAEV
jgi:heme-degrading monooxygenase HmoA